MDTVISHDGRINLQALIHLLMKRPVQYIVVSHAVQHTFQSDTDHLSVSWQREVYPALDQLTDRLVHLKQTADMATAAFEAACTDLSAKLAELRSAFPVFPVDSHLSQQPCWRKQDKEHTVEPRLLGKASTQEHEHVTHDNLSDWDSNGSHCNGRHIAERQTESLGEGSDPDSDPDLVQLKEATLQARSTHEVGEYASEATGAAGKQHTVEVLQSSLENWDCQECDQVNSWQDLYCTGCGARDG